MLTPRTSHVLIAVLAFTAVDWLTESLPGTLGPGDGNGDDRGLPSNDEYELAFGQDDVIPPTYSSCNSAASLAVSRVLAALVAATGSFLALQGHGRSGDWWWW